MNVQMSLKQLLLYQMGFLLFNDLNKNKTDNKIMERLKILQTAFEQIKVYQHNTHFQSIIDRFDFDLCEEDLKELNQTDTETQTEIDIEIKYIHPISFGMWLQEQTFINLGWTGTMDDSDVTKQYWRQLTGQAFIKSWKKQKITHSHIINGAGNSASTPYIDISITNNSVVNASQFMENLKINPIFELDIDQKMENSTNIRDTPLGSRKSRKSIDHGIISGINLFDTIVNKNVFCIACCLLWEPPLAHDVLTEFMSNPTFNINGSHISDTKPEIISDSLSECMSLSKSISNSSIGTMGTSYTGNGYRQIQCDLSIDMIHTYLLEMDYSDKKNPVKYDWKLMVDGLNAFQFKVVSIDDYTDIDILTMIERLKQGLVSSIHDQRSGLIKVACNLFVLLAQYRTSLFFEPEFFTFWIVSLLQKCANRDKIRTFPAHNACSDIVKYILSFYINNKDNTKEFLLHKLKEMFFMFGDLWTPHKIDITWMKQEKSVTQFIKNLSLMITHTAILHQTPNHKSVEINCVDDDMISVCNGVKPIQNKDILSIQEKAISLFKIFQKQSHKKARDCSIDLLINLYKLENESTFEFAKQHFVKRELKDWLNKLNKQKLLAEKHKKYLDSISSKKGTRTRITRIKKGSKKKKKKKAKGIKSQIKELKKKNVQITEEPIPQTFDTFDDDNGNSARKSVKEEMNV